MFRKKVTIFFVIITFGFVLGLICGVAPGYFLKNYALFGIGIGCVFFVFVFLLLTIFLFDYLLEKSLISFTHSGIFHPSLTIRDKISFIFSSVVFFIGGVLLGMICELILKPIGVSFMVHLIIGSICLFAVLIVLLFIFILAMQHDPEVKYENESSYERRDTSIDSTTNVKPTSSIQREYYTLLTSPKKFSLNERVYTNEDDLAQIMEIDGFGNYRIRYLRNGLTETKNGNDLRRA